MCYDKAVDFFSDYDGESYWDDTFLALQEEESALISRYYDLSGEGQEYGPRLEELYVELIALRQEQAARIWCSWAVSAPI